MITGDRERHALIEQLGFDPNETIVYQPPEGVQCRGTIIAFHGDAFVDGAPRQDDEQNRWLAETTRFQVHQLAFPKTAKQFSQWAASDCMIEFLMQQRQSFGKVFVLGRASGGYLAKWFRQLHPTLVDGAIYFSPVMDPAARARLLPRFAASTRQFFGDHDVPHNFVDAAQNDELYLLATFDNRVPESCSCGDLNDAERCSKTSFDNLSHADLAQCCSPALQNILDHFLRQ